MKVKLKPCPFCGKKMPLWFTLNKSAKVRSQTFQGIADAMAKQWGEI